MSARPGAQRARGEAALAGLVAVGAGLGVGELVAAFVAPTGGPIADVGGLMIDLAPTWAKDAAIALFGTADKIALLVGVGLVLAVLAGAAGILEARHPHWGSVLVGGAGAFGILAAATRQPFAVLDLLPALATTAVAIAALRMLLRLRPAAVSEPAPTTAAGPDRRRFLAWLGGTAAVGVLAAIGGTALRTGARVATAAREAFTLPAPATPAPPLPAGAELGIDGLAPVITPNADFYRIDTALQIPVVDPGSWRLRVHGMVDRELTLSWDELLALPLEESTTTLACVSNEVGGTLIGTAVWLGHPIRHLLEQAGVHDDADMVLSKSVDGFTAGTPLDVLRDDRHAVLAIGMNGEPLPPEHGFPVRLVVPGLYGYVSATKWVVDLEVTRFDRARAYWTDRGWSERGPIKLASRIDVPRGQVAAGAVTVAGVAWHQHVGIAAVEVQIDDRPWRDAQLAAPLSVDTWVQWHYRWEAEPGQHTVRVRAIGADGETQVSQRRPPAPDGATGLHAVTVDVV